LLRVLNNDLRVHVFGSKENKEPKHVCQNRVRFPIPALDEDYIKDFIKSRKLREGMEYQLYDISSFTI
jgi:hypothetical protein